MWENTVHFSALAMNHFFSIALQRVIFSEDNVKYVGSDIYGRVKAQQRSSIT